MNVQSHIDLLNDIKAELSALKNGFVSDSNSAPVDTTRPYDRAMGSVNGLVVAIGILDKAIKDAERFV
jgi:hypothetical protein